MCEGVALNIYAIYLCEGSTSLTKTQQGGAYIPRPPLPLLMDSVPPPTSCGHAMNGDKHGQTLISLEIRLEIKINIYRAKYFTLTGLGITIAQCLALNYQASKLPFHLELKFTAPIIRDLYDHRCIPIQI